MKTIIDYVNDLYKKNGSDYKTAKLLNLTKMGMSHIRKRGHCSDETAVKIAQELNINESEVLMAAAIARSSGEVKTAWEKISKAAGIAAYAFMLAGSAAPTLLKNTAARIEEVFCILC